MSFIQYCGIAVGICLGAYLLIRVATAAYYQSKQDYERSIKHGKK
jgi:hypothetical protein